MKRRSTLCCLQQGRLSVERRGTLCCPQQDRFRSRRPCAVCRLRCISVLRHQDRLGGSHVCCAGLTITANHNSRHSPSATVGVLGRALSLPVSARLALQEGGVVHVLVARLVRLRPWPAARGVAGPPLGAKGRGGGGHGGGVLPAVLLLQVAPVSAVVALEDYVLVAREEGFPFLWQGLFVSQTVVAVVVVVAVVRRWVDDGDTVEIYAAVTG